ncbi:Bacterial transcriptional activator domain protein [compost metagenome]
MYVYFKENSHLPSSLDCLERLVAVSPDSEKDGRELIKLHIEAGNRNEALKAYWHLEKAVHDRMGVEVEEETEALYRQLVSAEASLRSVL